MLCYPARLYYTLISNKVILKLIKMIFICIIVGISLF